MSYSKPMSGLGLIEMPSYGVWSSSEVRQQAERLNLQVQSTASSVSTNRSRLIAASGGEAFYNEWNTFKTQWQQYFGPAAASTLGFQQSALRTFVDRYNSLETRYAQLTGVSPVQTVTQDTRLEPGSVFGSGAASLNTYLMVGAGVIGVVALAVLATQLATIVRPATRLMANRRRHRRSR